MSRAGAGLLRPYFFDCLHLDGADLLALPLRERLTALERVASACRVCGRAGRTPGVG